MTVGGLPLGAMAKDHDMSKLTYQALVAPATRT